MAEQLIRKTVAAREGEQLAVCPECGVQMPGRQRSEHLVQAHGYVEVSGLLLPRPEALAHLWDRVFIAGDAEAHERVARLLAEETVEGAEAPYRTALETELLRRADHLFAARWQELPRLVRCLRQSATALPHFRGLLRAGEPRVREVGRELLLPDVCQQLAPGGTAAEEVRHWLDRLCPFEGVEEKIRLCQRLAQLGADVTATAACLEELQSERPVVCPECREPVPRSRLDDHLRQVHRIHQFRGSRYPAGEIVAVLAAAVCSPEPDTQAWKELVELARDNYKRQAEAFLADTLCQVLRGVAAEQRTETITAVAQTIAAAGCKPRQVTLLAANPEPAGRHLALALATRLPPPLDGAVIGALRPLLMDTRLPEGAHLEAAAAFLRTTGPAGPAAKEVLGAFTAGLGKSHAVERLARLKQLAGKSAAIDELSTRLENRIRMRCPRCPTELRRRDMVQHLWLEHHLVLDGRRVREPEQLIEDWVAEYRQSRDPELLERCRILGQRLDPQHGLTRVYRLFLIAGIDDPEARRTLLAEAEQHRTSLCPHCYALVPIPQVVPPAAVSLNRGRLSARGYRVEIVQKGLRPWLEIETPGEAADRTRQQGRPLTLKGAIFLFAGSFVAAALLLAFLLPVVGVRPLAPVLIILAMASLVYLLIQYLWREPRPLPDQAVDYAWKLLVPKLHPSAFSLEDLAFVAGLALASLTHGRPATRKKQLERALNMTENAAADGAARHLSCLHRLAIADAAAAGADPVPLVVAQVGRCFDGKLPLVFAEELLAGWEADYWNAGNRARLRLALCDRAFEAGFEVRNLLEAARTAPALGELLLKDETSALAWLRLLWSLRARRPWDPCGEAMTAFELAADAAASVRLLTKYSDLLLLQELELAPGSEAEAAVSAQIILCGRGVVFQEQLFSSPPRSLEILAKRANGRDGFELLVNERRFWFWVDPGEVALRLERWCRFYFGELLPQVAGVYEWQSPSVAATLRAHDMVRCPECQRPLLTRIGEEGVAIDPGPASTGPRPSEA